MLEAEVKEKLGRFVLKK